MGPGAEHTQFQGQAEAMQAIFSEVGNIEDHLSQCQAKAFCGVV